MIFGFLELQLIKLSCYLLIFYRKFLIVLAKWLIFVVQGLKSRISREIIFTKELHKLFFARTNFEKSISC